MDLSLIKEKFIEETEALLIKLDNTIINLEKDPQNSSYIEDAYRITHTIKGSAGMVGFEHIVDITHEMENIYDMVKHDGLKVTPTIIELTFASADYIRGLISDEENIDYNIPLYKLLKEHLTQIKNSFRNSGKKTEIQTQVNINSWNILFYPNNHLSPEIVNLVYIFHELFALGNHYIVNQPFNSNEKQYWSIFLITGKPLEEIKEVLKSIMDYCKITKVADFDIFNSTQLNQRSRYVESLKKRTTNEEKEIETIINQNIDPNNETSINVNNLKKSYINLINKKKTTNVDISKLDTLMSLVNELDTTKSALSVALQEQNLLAANKAAEKIEKLSKLFSENAISIRLVSFTEMLSKFNRLIRDLAKELGKKVEFITVGENTEIDKNIIDAIAIPLMHIIRNNIDHGIESPQKRKEAGKPETGIIRFEANKSGSYINITISDDGVGIDTDFIYNKAIEKGFVNKNAELSTKEIYNLIFLPGFTTAKNLTKISGRGIGMDIVRKNIQEMQGEISISSSKGVGTSFNIKLHQGLDALKKTEK